MRVSGALLALLVAVAAPVPGCRITQGPPSRPPLVRTLAPETYLRRAAARTAEVRSLRADAKVSLTGPRGRYRFSEALNVIRPRRVRLDTIGPFSRVFSVLASDGERLVFLDPGAKRMYRGSPTRENLARFLPFSLDVEDIVAILLGGVPEAARRPFVSYDAKNEVFLVRTENRSGSESLATLDGRTLDLVRLQIIDPPPVLAAVVEYEGWEARSGIAFPNALSIRVPSRDVLMRIAFEHLEPNAVIADSLFAIHVPQSFEVVPMRQLPPPVDYNLAPGLTPEPGDARAEEEQS
ncbi:MAG: DUF4292 domain-containing protein [Myxococcota bacterium]